MTYPVHFSVEQPERFSRVQLAIRIAALISLGVCGMSLGGIFGAAYLALPIYAASRLASLGSAEDYLRQDRSRVTWALHWFAAITSWTGLVTDRLPARAPEETLSLRIDDVPWRPTPGTAILRVVTGLPSWCVLMVLGVLGSVVWIWAACSIVINERVASGAFQYLLGLERWAVRLLAYQACLVEEYPPFSFSDEMLLRGQGLSG